MKLLNPTQCAKCSKFTVAIYCLQLINLQCFLYVVKAATKVTNPEREAQENEITDHLAKHHHRSNIFVLKDMDDTKFSDELGYHHHLPEQTHFDLIDEPVTSRVLLTSPPQLTIKPSPVQRSSHRSSDGNSFTSHFSVSVSHFAKPEACISETPTFDFSVVDSFKQSESIDPGVVVMAGRLETASSTESLNDRINTINALSQPSTEFVQGVSITSKLDVSGECFI